MPSRQTPDRMTRRGLIAVSLATVAVGAAPAMVAGARADSTPVGPLPPGPSSVITTAPGQLVAVALPHAPKASGLVWRIARRYDARVLRETSEADVADSVVVVFKVLGRGRTTLRFAATRGDASPTAAKSATYSIRSS